MSARKLLIFCVLVLTVGTPNLSNAQAICPPGFMSVGGAGQCIPEPTQGAQEAPRRQQWTDRWGAIAIGDPGILGTSRDQPNKRAAKNAAIKHCIERGGAKCKSVKEYKNQCISVASGKSGSAHAFGPDELDARRRSISMCEGTGSSNCRILYSNCTDAVPRH